MRASSNQINHSSHLIDFPSTQIIATRNSQRKTVVTKSCDVDLLTETDQEVERLLMASLAKQFPDHR